MKHTIRCSYLTCLYNTLHLRLNHLYSQSKGVGEVPFENFSEENPNRFASTTTLQYSLESAIRLFEEKQEQSFDKLYGQKIFKQNLILTLKLIKKRSLRVVGIFHLCCLSLGRNYYNLLNFVIATMMLRPALELGDG